MAVPNFVELEKDILKKWKDEDVFKKTLKKKAPKGRFVFFEGPPTANGQPHIGHVETRVFKDLIPRFKTMQGFRVERKAGWDTQGLPVELEVERAIGVSGKKDIEAYGIEKFNEACKASVWKYKGLWEEMTERVGFWLDVEHPYITYENSYIETLWWILKQAWDAKLLVQDYKVVPYCYRCGTALSSHELAQGYERVKERGVYVKFRVRAKSKDWEDTSIISWTTTPWTLPGNVALAVNPKEEYVCVPDPDEAGHWLVLGRVPFQRMLAEGLFSKEYADLKLLNIDVFSGSDMVGVEYEPLFDFLDLRTAPSPHRSAEPPSGRGAAYTVVPADFVTTEEGTGVVHTAVMYGEDDFNLGKKLDLPQRHTVNEDGTFNELVSPWAGKNVKAKETDDAIVEYLRNHGKLYKEELYEHDYPFCWRCHTPLLYYAKTSWFITMSKLRRELLANNERINWIPEHIKEGRFGEWLREVKDWAISRERYWGTPLPFWVCDYCKHQECIGSYEELIGKLPLRNRYYLVRHAEAKNNAVKRINADVEKGRYEVLTERGREQAQRAAARLHQEKVDAVYSSQFQRTRETAEIIAQQHGLKVLEDARLNEYRMGSFEGRTEDEFHEEFASKVDRFRTAPPGGETWHDVRTRFMEFLLQLDQTHQGKTFVIVSHGDPILVVLWATSLKAESQISEVNYPEFAEPVELKLPSQLFSGDGRFDPHRPFIDRVTYPCAVCTKGTKRRVPEVADTWFDSGSMPFAQWHYPFEHRERVDKGLSFPADFISEAIDQTRGWFYTLLAVATILHTAKAIAHGHAFKHCVVLGHIRDKHGRKLSKSLGNYIDPMVLLQKHGADAIRMYLFTVNQPSEPKNFDEEQVAEVVKKNFMILWNVLNFWKLGVGRWKSEVRGQKFEPITDFRRPTSNHVMDRWMLARLGELKRTMTEHLNQYAVVDAGRELTLFVTDISTWYVRRSRERAKAEDRNAVVATLGYVLREYAKLSAPFTPFLSDTLWRKLGGTTSVHLEAWPAVGKRDTAIIAEMDVVRSVVETGHALRALARIKVRQPLSQIALTRVKLDDDVQRIVADELNVKEIHHAPKTPTGSEWKTLQGVSLDTTITDELREEGYVREMVRAVNALRKELSLKPGEPLAAVYACDTDTEKVVAHFMNVLKEKGSLSSLTRVDVIAEKVVVAELDEGRTIRFGKG